MKPVLTVGMVQHQYELNIDIEGNELTHSIRLSTKLLNSAVEGFYVIVISVSHFGTIYGFIYPCVDTFLIKPHWSPNIIYSANIV